MNYCPKCRKKLVVQDFCVECGADLSEYLKNSGNSSESGLGSFDFSAFEKAANDQLSEQKIRADFEIENGVLIKYKGQGGKVVVPEDVTVIGKKAFWNTRSKITEVVFKGNITEIGEAAFEGCYNIKRMELPSSLKKIGEAAFLALGVEDIELPRGILFIGDGAFSRSKLKSITVPGGAILEELEFGTRGIGIFSHCDDLQNVIIENGVTAVTYSMFYSCENLRSVILPESVKNIGLHAFYRCKSLKSINLPSGLTAIEAWAFYGCSSLLSITIPYGVTRIEERTFSSCLSLDGVTLPEGLKAIGETAFEGCKNLSSIIIPKSVKKIDEMAFLRCDNLRTVKLPLGLNVGYLGATNAKVIRY